MKKIISIIPARGGSKGVPNKNITLLGGFPLLAYSIIASRTLSLIEETYVSTNSPEIASVAKEYGAEVIERPDEISGDTSTDLEWAIHAIEWFMKEKEMPDLIVHLRTTTPLRNVLEVKKAIQIFLQYSEATSLRSAHKLEESPYKMFVKDEDFFKPFMQGEGEFYNKPRQEFPHVYAPNGYVDILRVEHILKNRNLHGDKILAFETEKVIEVDSLNNLIELQKCYKENSIYQYLDSHS